MQITPRTIEKVRRIAVGQELKWAIEEEMKDRGLEWDEAVIKDAIDRAINSHLYGRPHPSQKWS